MRKTQKAIASLEDARGTKQLLKARKGKDMNSPLYTTEEIQHCRHLDLSSVKLCTADFKNCKIIPPFFFNHKVYENLL